jgi:hypothetical protein
VEGSSIPALISLLFCNWIFFANCLQNRNSLDPVISKMETTSSFTSPLGVVYKTKFFGWLDLLSIMGFDNYWT